MTDQANGRDSALRRLGLAISAATLASVVWIISLIWKSLARLWQVLARHRYATFVLVLVITLGALLAWTGRRFLEAIESGDASTTTFMAQIAIETGTSILVASPLVYILSVAFQRQKVPQFADTLRGLAATMDDHLASMDSTIAHLVLGSYPGRQAVVEVTGEQLPRLRQDWGLFFSVLLDLESTKPNTIQGLMKKQGSIGTALADIEIQTATTKDWRDADMKKLEGALQVQREVLNLVLKDLAGYAPPGDWPGWKDTWNDCYSRSRQFLLRGA